MICFSAVVRVGSGRNGAFYIPRVANATSELLNIVSNEEHMKSTQDNLARESRFAKLLYGDLSPATLNALKGLLRRHRISVKNGDVIYFDGGWYVSHSGLLKLAERRRCAGIHVQPVSKSCDPHNSRWVFRAIVFKSPTCKGFVGYGDADPSNTSSLVRGAELRVAETRAVNRALRKAYGIGICSVEEIGSFAESSSRESKKLPAQPANGNYGGPKVRDRLCQIIRQHQLDPTLVKTYAIDFCGTKTLREATRAQVENFVAHLADWAQKDRNALLCQLNSYSPVKGSAA